MGDIKAYVLGFAFTENGGWLLTIKKTKPEWQAGKMNGIGGKVEPWEPYGEAMVREFREETGINTIASDWTQLGSFSGTDWNGGEYVVSVYSMFSDEVHSAYTATDEVVQLIPSTELDRYPVIPNLKWLVPMALNAHNERGMSHIRHFEVQYA